MLLDQVGAMITIAGGLVVFGGGLWKLGMSFHDIHLMVKNHEARISSLEGKKKDDNAA